MTQEYINSLVAAIKREVVKSVELEHIEAKARIANLMRHYVLSTLKDR